MMTSSELDRLANNTGCKMHEDCLTCPLPSCIYDTNRGIQRLETMQKYSAMRQECEHMSQRAVARKFGVHLKTVQRALEVSK